MPYKKVVNFFHEIYSLLKNSKRELDEPWLPIKEIEFFSDLNENAIEFFQNNFDFFKREQWNYISINKIQFILDSLQFLNYAVCKLSKILNYQGFEQLIKEILSLNGFEVAINYRFTDHSYFKYGITTLG